MMYSTCPGVGLNPFSVNVITYSGQGFNLDGEEIAIIPEIDREKNVEIRFINFSGLARKFASIPHSINIFLLGKCRIFLNDESKKLIDQDPEHYPEDFFYKNLKRDALNSEHKT